MFLNFKQKQFVFEFHKAMALTQKEFASNQQEKGYPRRTFTYSQMKPAST